MFRRKNGYNRYLNPPPQSRTRLLYLPLALLVLGATVYFLLVPHDPAGTTPFTGNQPASPPATKTAAPAAQPKPVVKAAAAHPVETVVASKVCQGDTMTGILGAYLTPQEILGLARVCEPVFPLSDIRPGHPYVLGLRDEELAGFEYEINDEHKLVVAKKDQEFKAKKEDIVYEKKRGVIQGTIESSLSLALDGLGEGPGLAVMMEDILGWDVDFGRDIRQGDLFKILVEKRFRRGKPAGYGPILAMDFHNRDRVFRAFRFTDAKGRASYYDENGKSMRKAFLKAPLSFTRISSGYSNRRFHPILKRWRPHHGVDYAAPRGTPIRTVGDGVVVTRAYDKAAGRYVKIRHPRGYETVYNHMSRFARSIRKGKQVKQGQVIGYVGATGYATGPHLDFRVKRHGSYINPLRMKSPPTKPVPPKQMDRFREEASLLAREMGAPLPEERVMEAGTKGNAHPKG
ncbi:peptidoglycan DD-metalloendopeptidase family protein [Desulfoplanes sp.]